MTKRLCMWALGCSSSRDGSSGACEGVGANVVCLGFGIGLGPRAVRVRSARTEHCRHVTGFSIMRHRLGIGTLEDLRGYRKAG